MYTEEEQQHLEYLFQELIYTCKSCQLEEDKQSIQKAFDFAYNAYNKIRRRSGEPYIIHSLSVAKIVAGEIGLGVRSVISAILHEIIDTTDYTLRDIENQFGDKVAFIVEGLRKLNNQPPLTQKVLDINIQVSDKDKQRQAESFRKLLLTLSEDVRVILIKLADQLHNMRTFSELEENEKAKINNESMLLYAPLAHQLGLYRIKTELEDLCFKVTQPEVYKQLSDKIKYNEKEYLRIINNFTHPLTKKLKKQNLNYEITYRQKSIYSTWRKMKRKGVSLREVYDLLAVRIVFNNNGTSESSQCWQIYGIISEMYTPNQERTRDWVSHPKNTGYEALHGTFMGPDGRWIEVQIRSKRMHEIAEKGYAAHWKYKGVKTRENEIEKWMTKVRDVLESKESNALRFLDEIKLNLFSSEIIVFTPKGKIISLPKNASVLDFAFEIHSDLAYKCIGAKINRQIVPLSYILKSGDQVEILTSENQKPKPEWINFVITSRAKNGLKTAFKEYRRKYIQQGKRIMEETLSELELVPNSHIFKKIFRSQHVSNKNDLYYKIGSGIIPQEALKKVLRKRSRSKLIRYWQIQLARKINKKELTSVYPSPVSSALHDDDLPLLNEKKRSKMNFTIADCCNPIPGDDVIGYQVNNHEITIHKTSCQHAINLRIAHPEAMLHVEWTHNKLEAYLARIKLKGVDRIGLINNVTNLISKKLNINMRAINFETQDDIFNGRIDLYVHNIADLHNLIADLRKIDGVKYVNQVENVE